MSIFSATKARANLYRLIEETLESHQPIVIKGKKGNAVILSEDDWNSINETLYLLSVPGMRDSIVEGRNTPIDECAEELDW
ncbi:MAG: antitoxin [Gammaproteobacteria bacterium RBG_16_51_14]|nr:MAG: antitoxin [Gammaproteobacteria bacterium RBG_16_51_14]